MMKKKNRGELSHSNPTSVRHINRNDWKEQVNDASMNGWIVVTMTEPPGSHRHDHVIQALHKFSQEQYNQHRGNSRRNEDDDSCAHGESMRLLVINANDAIPNWPEERVPAMFAYRNGIKQHEWIASRRGEFPSKDNLEQIFRKWGI